MNLFRLIKQFRLATGRSPSPNELAKLKQQSELMSRDNVIKFPEGGIDSIPVDKQFGGKKSLDEFTRSENIYEQSMKPKGEGTLKFEKELNVNLYGDETFEELMQIKDTGKHPRDKAAGGRIGFAAGGAKGLLKLLQGKLGKKTLKMADDVDRPKSALDREMFDAANKRFNQKVNERTSAAEVGIDDLFDKDGVLNKDAVLSDITKSVEKTKKSKIVKTKTPDKALLKAMDEIGGGTGDLKYDADVLADELAFQRGLIPEGGDITDIADQMKRMDLYDEAYSALSQQFLKNREIKKMQQFYDERRSTSVFTDEYQKNLDKEVMKEFDFSKKQFDKLSEEAKENFRRQYDGNYADAMEDTAGIIIKDPRPSEPTQTLKSIKEKGAIDISDPTIADEFDTFLRENDPEGYKNLEQKIQLDTFDTKGRKKNAVGGLAYMLGEEPRSMYNDGGGAGAPPVTYDDNIDNIGPGPTMPPNTMMNTPAIDPRLLNQGRGTGIMIDPKTLGMMQNENQIQSLADGGRIGLSGGGIARLLKFLKKFKRKKSQSELFEEDLIKIREDYARENKKFYDGLKPGGELEQNIEKVTGFQFADTDEIMKKIKKKMGNREDNVLKEFDITDRKPNAMGGRIGFKKGGGMDRRGFLKLMGGLATLPVLGKFFKGAKVASKVVPLKGTTTTMPAWFPDLVDKFVARGIGKKIDQDLMEYTTKELPGVKMAKSDNGKIIVEGKNEYGRPYAIEYEPPGYEVIDEVKGKAVKTKGDFRATDVVPESSGAPDDVPDFFPEQLDSVDDILSSDARVMEEFATGKKVKNIKQGESSLLQAEQRLDSSLNDIDEFASGGLAKLLGE